MATGAQKFAGSEFTPKGTKRQRHRRGGGEVAGPYRSESSNPKIRSEATPHEHRTVAPPPVPVPRVPGITSPLPRATRSFRSALAAYTPPPAPETALQMALEKGILPGPDFKRAYGPAVFKAIEDARMHYIASKENLGEPEDLTNLALLLTGVGDVALLAKGGELGAKTAAAAGAEALAKQGASTAESSALIRGLSKIVGARGAARGVVGRTAAKAEPEASAALRKAVAGKVAGAAERLPTSVRVAGKAASRAATAPVRHPFTAPLAVQTPAALTHGDPSEYLKALGGQGTLADIGNALGGAVGSVVPMTVGENLVHDAFNLPAQILPSVYLPLAGAVEAAQGDPSRIKQLLAVYKRTGFLPAVFSGDTAAALRSLEAHPLYAALETGGAAALAGRGAGALVRGASGGRLAGTARPPVFIPGQEHLGNVNELMGRGRYSPDLIRQLAQRAYDARRGPNVEPGRFRDPATRAIRHTARRFAFGEEQLRRVNRSERLKLMHESRPKSGRFRTDRASAGVVSQAVQRIIQKPETFAQDLSAYRIALEREYKSGGLTSTQQKANREMVKQVDAAIHSGNPEEVVRAANSFITTHGKVVDGLVEHGLINADQGAQAVLFPWARVHFGAEYKPGVGLVDRHGDPLSTEAVVANMKHHGVEPPGFLSQRPRSPGAKAYFQGFFPERASLYGQPRTGAATLGGTYDASYRALTEQLLFSGSKLDAAKSFDKMIRQFGSKVPDKVKTMHDAWEALADPERYGWKGPPPGVKMRPIRTAPFRAAAEQIQKAQAHQGLDSPLLDPNQSAASENLGAQLLDAAAKDGPGPYAYIPEAAYKELHGQFKGAGTAEKAGQLVGQLFKGAVLPFSPSWYVGNALDSFIRTTLAGVGPSDVLLGYQAIHGRRGRLNLSKREPIPGLRSTDPAAAESIVPGAGYSSVARQAVHRDARQFEGTALQGVARGIEALGRTHGPKELLHLYRSSRDLLMGINSHLFERLPQYGVVGKELRRELQSTSGHWHHALMVSDGAFEDLLKGLRGTDKQIQYARAVEEVFGSWGKIGPFGRHVLNSFMPFWQWARAASRFVLLTLPAHHPIVTGLIAAAADMTDAERKRLGLDKYAAEPLPGFLQGGLPIEGGISPWAKYASPGVFSDYPNFLGRLFFPQLSSGLQALQGLDWKGEKLMHNGKPAGEPERLQAAAAAFGESFIPGFNLIKTIASGEPEKLSPVFSYTGSTLSYLRSLSNSRQITVPAAGSGGSSGSSSGGTGLDYGRVFSGGASGAAPWKAGSSTSSEKAPWK